MISLKDSSVFDNSVLMVYAVLPKIQASKKQLFKSNLAFKGLQLFEALQQRTQEIANASGLETVWFYDHEIPGRSFGERYSTAFANLFEKGYEHVISIGNDIPQLQISHIHQAVSSLESYTAVLGPTVDGGDYLIAFSADSFDKESFSNLPWNSPHLHQKLTQSFQKNTCEVYFLEELIDVDDFEALQSIGKIYSLKWIRMLLQILKQYSPKFNDLLQDFLIQKDNPLRAPPFFHPG